MVTDGPLQCPSRKEILPHWKQPNLILTVNYCYTLNKKLKATKAKQSLLKEIKTSWTAAQLCASQSKTQGK